MIPVVPVRRPRGFVKKCQAPGNEWIKKHPNAQRPYHFWSPFLETLAAGFNHLCGYSAMYTSEGTVDHYLSYKKHPQLAYDWSNYRFVSGKINSSKQNEDQKVLDPYEVKPGWFEILLPSLQLIASPSIPQKWRGRAKYTLTRLKLDRHQTMVRQRQHWYKQYQAGKETLEALRDHAPLIAEAVERQPARYLRGEITRRQLALWAPSLEPKTPARPPR